MKSEQFTDEIACLQSWFDELSYKIFLRAQILFYQGLNRYFSSDILLTKLNFILV